MFFLINKHPFKSHQKKQKLPLQKKNLRASISNCFVHENLKQNESRM
jgi:hypothetical protein